MWNMDLSFQEETSDLSQMQETQSSSLPSSKCEFFLFFFFQESVPYREHNSPSLTV